MSAFGHMEVALFWRDKMEQPGALSWLARKFQGLSTRSLPLHYGMAAAAVATIVIYGAVTLFAPSPAQATHVLVRSR